MLVVQTKTGEENSVLETTLFVYGDQYREKLLATCLLELHAMVTLYARLRAGLQSTQTLAVPSENARSVAIYSSDPRLVTLPQREVNRTFRLVPQTINHIQVTAKTLLPT